MLLITTTLRINPKLLSKEIAPTLPKAEPIRSIKYNLLLLSLFSLNKHEITTPPTINGMDPITAYMLKKGIKGRKYIIPMVIGILKHSQIDVLVSNSLGLEYFPFLNALNTHIPPSPLPKIALETIKKTRLNVRITENKRVNIISYKKRAEASKNMAIYNRNLFLETS
ncbi:hypothetical protein [Anaerosolibacter sp.]|uniref:hypothetical protein n=1 Tax=Anaerosolibacter sp. TaxID=1872527 RepID=UPI0039F0A432